MKNKKGRRGRNVDRLSRLPDDVLLHILEKLDTPDALRACVLSRRLLSLPAKLSRIAISIRSMAPRSGRSMTGRDLPTMMNAAVADVTERVTSGSEVPIRDLSVTFSLRMPNCLSIGGSDARAMAAEKLVGAAEFFVGTEVGRGERRAGDLVRFGRQFMDFVGACPGAFAGLTRLRLRNMRFGDGDVAGILAACGRLESLRLEQCDSGPSSVVRVEHANLVELEICRGRFDFDRVDLGHLPKLRRVTCKWWYSREDPMTFGFVPQLSELSLAANGTPMRTYLELSKLLANATTVRCLHLDFVGEAIWVVPERPGQLAPVLRQLRILNLDNLPEGCDIGWTMFFLEAAPNLRELQITVRDNGDRGDREIKNVEWEPSAPDFRHENLSKLTIHGFQHDDNILGYIRRVKKAAVNMEDVYLYDMEGGRCDAETSEIPTDRQGEEESHSTGPKLANSDAMLPMFSEDPISKDVRRCSLQVKFGCPMFVCVAAVACLLVLVATLLATWGLDRDLLRHTL